MKSLLNPLWCALFLATTPPSQDEVPVAEPTQDPAQEEEAPSENPEGSASETQEPKAGTAESGSTDPTSSEGDEPGEVGEPELPDWREEWAAESAERASSDFRLTDADRNGWISLREASAALEADREEFARYDADRDGRWDLPEFEARFRRVLARLGAVPFPNVRFGRVEETVPLTAATPLEVLRSFDTDKNRALDEAELTSLAEAYSIELPLTEILRRVDTDSSGSMELHELEALNQLFEEHLRFQALAAGELPVSTNPLFRKAPKDPLLRLDLDGDGSVSLDELIELGSGLRFSVRPAAVHAFLDQNGDGRLTRRELERAMGG